MKKINLYNLKNNILMDQDGAENIRVGVIANCKVVIDIFINSYTELMDIHLTPLEEYIQSEFVNYDMWSNHIDYVIDNHDKILPECAKVVEITQTKDCARAVLSNDYVIQASYSGITLKKGGL